MDEQDILQRITTLVDEERELRERAESASPDSGSVNSNRTLTSAGICCGSGGPRSNTAKTPTTRRHVPSRRWRATTAEPGHRTRGAPRR